MTSLDPVIEKLFTEATSRGASDIHLEPVEGGLEFRVRVQGQMASVKTLPASLQESLLAKIKLLSSLDPTERARPQDGAMVVGGLESRVSVIPVLGGESVVIRLLHKLPQLATFEGLGMTATDRQKLSAGLAPGLIIIAGPTGAGKTTSFYAALRSLDANAQKIITVEDPVEQRLEGVCQVAVTKKLGFADALRSILRQAPNVIGVGELRDSVSMAMAQQAALTGHIVVATVHAATAAEVPSRLLELGATPAILAQSLQVIVAQRLVNVVDPDKPSLRTRTGIFEVVRPSADFRSSVAAGAASFELEKILSASGHFALSQTAQQWLKEGKITQGEYLAEFGL